MKIYRFTEIYKFIEAILKQPFRDCMEYVSDRRYGIKKQKCDHLLLNVGIIYFFGWEIGIYHLFIFKFCCFNPTVKALHIPTLHPKVSK